MCHSGQAIERIERAMGDVEARIDLQENDMDQLMDHKDRTMDHRDHHVDHPMDHMDHPMDHMDHPMDHPMDHMDHPMDHMDHPMAHPNPQMDHPMDQMVHSINTVDAPQPNTAHITNLAYAPHACATPSLAYLTIHLASKYTLRPPHHAQP